MSSFQVSFAKSSGGSTVVFEAGRTYVIANVQLERLLADEKIRSQTYKVSRLESRVTNFHVSARRAGTQRLLIYNGSGGYGDQVLTWPLANLLASMGYEVHVITEPGNAICWWHFPFIKTVNTIPIPYEQVKLYDYFLFYEAVVNMDEHQDQEHILDVMLRKIGIDPAAVDPKLKSIRPLFTGAELASTQAVYPDKQIAIYQMASANPVRCLPPNDSVFMLTKLAEAYPQFHWLALWDEFIKPEYKKVLEEKIEQAGIKNVEPHRAVNLRELWALAAQRARVTVAPDSMMVHVCGALGAPCVGLWGPIAPDRRVKYYTNHLPIWHREFCIHAPCFAYTSTYPKLCPPRNDRKVCEVLAGISPTEVIDAIKQVVDAAAPKS